MALLKLLILSLTFNELIVDLDAKSCPEGHKVVNGDHCEPCSLGNYLPDGSTACILCTICEKGTGSDVLQPCTKNTDAKCRCRTGFVSWDNDFSTCKCNPGYGKEGNECLKCKEGYFNNDINASCKKWTNCESAGVKVNGTSTSDVTCNPSVSKTPTPTKSVPHAPTTHRPQEGATTQKPTTTTLQKLTSTDKVSPNAPSNTGSYIGMALVIFGIAGLLVLTALTCKMHITPYWKTTTGQKLNSSCRKPIEEIGDVSESSAKLNPGEP